MNEVEQIWDYTIDLIKTYENDPFIEVDQLLQQEDEIWGDVVKYFGDLPVVEQAVYYDIAPLLEKYHKGLWT